MAVVQIGSKCGLAVNTGTIGGAGKRRISALLFGPKSHHVLSDMPAKVRSM
jgi:hypothetical protein